MIGATDVFDTVKSMIETANPNTTVYTNDIPWGFERPAFLLEQTGRTEQDIAKGLKQVTVSLTVTCFVTVDSHDVSDQSELLAAQAGIKSLFSQGYIVVGGRAPKVRELSGEVDKDAAYVDVVIEYAEETRKDATCYPKMGAIAIKTEKKEG